MATERKEIKKPKPLPAPNSDFYQFAEDLPAEEMAIVKKVRETLPLRKKKVEEK